MVIDGQQVRIRNYAGSVHFELEKIFPIDILRPIDAIQNSQADFAISVRFGVRNFKALADFFGHVVSPARSICGGHQ